MDLVVLVPSWCCHAALCSHLLIGVPLPKVTVLQYCHSVTAGLLEKSSFLFACRIFILLSEHTKTQYCITHHRDTICVSSSVASTHRTVRNGHSRGEDFNA